MIQHVNHHIVMVVAITKRVLAAAVLLGLLALRSSAQDLPDFKAEAFDPVPALGILTDATANETGAAPPATGLASPIVVDTLFGTSTTRIPIELPPGRNGLTPDVTVRYSSNGPNDIFGVGWNLTLGYIKRSTVPGIPLVGGLNANGNYSDANGFVLLFRGGTAVLDRCQDTGTCNYWSASSEEIALQAQFIRSSNTWSVTDSRGVVYTFGAVPGARVGTNITSSASTYGWYLTDIQDQNSNTVHISYLWAVLPPAPLASEYPNANSYAYPVQIDYGANPAAGFAHIFHVQFSYETRPDTAVSFRSGFPEQMLERVNAVTVWTDGYTTQASPTRQYQFGYQQNADTGASLLSTVSETVAAGTAAPPGTTFTYQSSAHGFAAAADLPPPSHLPASPLSLSLTSGSAYVNRGPIRGFADINGDGLPDFLDGYPSSYADLYHNLGGGNFGYTPSWTTLNDGAPPPSMFALSDWYMKLIDMDGDGLPDVIKSNTSSCSTPGGATTCAWELHKNVAGTLQTTAGSWPGVPVDLSGIMPQPLLTFYTYKGSDFADVNGDGLPDLIDCDANVVTQCSGCGAGSATYYPQWGGCQFYLNTGSRFAAGYPMYVPDLSTYDPPCQGAYGLCTNVSPLAAQDLTNGSTTKQLIDINGDGLPDLVTSRPMSGTGHWDVWLNTGNGFAWAPIAWAAPTCGTAVCAIQMTQTGGTVRGLRDMNGDGLPDYVDATTSPWTVYVNTGSGFSTTSIPWSGTTGLTVISAWTSGYAQNVQTSEVFDINGDGIADYVQVSPNAGKFLQARLGQGQRANLLMGEQNNLGASWSANYVPSTDPNSAGYGCQGGSNDGAPCDTNAECPGGTCTVPCADCSKLPFPTWVVNTVTEHSGSSNDLTTWYVFTGGYLDPLGRQFRGFRESQEVRADYRLIQRRYAPSPFAASTSPQWSVVFSGGIPSRPFKLVDEQVSILLGPLLKRSTVDWGTATLNGSRVQVHPTQRVDTTFSTSGTTTKTRTRTFDAYDSYNNITSTTLSGDDVAATTTTIGYWASTLCHSLPQQLTVTGGGMTWSVTNFTYDTRCNPLTVAELLAPAGQSANLGTPLTTTTLVYDSAIDSAAAATGQPTKRYDANNNLRTVSYACNQGLYPCTITNSLNQATSKQYNLQWGKPTSITPPSGSQSTTTYTYDGLGRLKTVVRPPVSVPAEQFVYAYGSGTPPSRTDTYIREPNATLAGPDGNTGYRLVSTFYDGLGRKLEIKQAQYVGGIATGVISEAVAFDGVGRVATRYVPKASASGITPANLQTYEPVQSWFGTSYSYDAMDRVIRTTNPDGTYRTVDYSYAGQTTTLDENYNVGSNGSKTVVTIDALGRNSLIEEYVGPTPLTKITQTQSTYDGLGRTVQKTVTDFTKNPVISAPTTFAYDSLSRRTSLADPDSGTWSYGYDSAGNLVYQNDPKINQHLEFCYDQLNRLNRKLYFTSSDTIASDHATRCTQGTPAQPYIDYLYDANTTYGCSSPDIGYLCAAEEHRTDTEVASTGDRRFRHDARGRATTESVNQSVTVNGVVHSGSLSYNEVYDVADRLIWADYPATGGSDPLFYAFNDLGQLSWAADLGQLYAYNIAYDIFGRMTQWTAGSGVVNTAVFSAWNTNFRLQDLSVSNSGGSVYQQFDYIDNGGLGYDSVGNLKGFADNTNYAASLKNAWVYQYDGLERLTSAKLNAGTPVPFTYDGLDNMTAYGALAFTPATGTHHISSSTGSQSGQYQYDNNGALTARPDTDTSGPDSSRTINYDIDGRVAKVMTGDGHTIHSVYNFRGERIARVTDGSTITFYYGKRADVTGTTLTRHMYLGNRLIADSPVTAPSGLLSSLEESQRQTLFASVGDAVITGAGVYPVAAFTQVAAVMVGGGFLVLFVGLAFAPGRVRLGYLGKVHRGRVALVTLAFVTAMSPLPYARPSWGLGGGSYPTYPVYFIHTDHLGSTTMLTCYKQSNCSDGAVVRYYRYDAYGRPTAYDASGNVIAIDTALTNGYIPERLYTGQRWDRQAGLYDFGARFYDPKIATFLTQDPFREYVNPYGYVAWNPVGYVDIQGRFIFLAPLAAVGVAGLVGGLASVYVNGSWDTLAFANGFATGAGSAALALALAYPPLLGLSPIVASATAGATFSVAGTASNIAARNGFAALRTFNGLATVATSGILGFAAGAVSGAQAQMLGATPKAWQAVPEFRAIADLSRLNMMLGYAALNRFTIQDLLNEARDNGVPIGDGSNSFGQPNVTVFQPVGEDQPVPQLPQGPSIPVPDFVPDTPQFPDVPVPVECEQQFCV